MEDIAESADAPRMLSCWTAPGVTFNTEADLKEHYRSDWHRYNLKRKVAGLAPLDKSTFDNRSQATESAQKGKGAKGRNKKERTAKGEKLHPNSKAANALKRAEMTEDQYLEKKISEGDKYTPDMDLFSSHRSKDAIENVEFMHQKYGFTIPDWEYLEDLENLLQYLGEKIYVGHISLYGNKEFHSTEAVQSHMKDKGECKFDPTDEEYETFWNMDALIEESPLWKEVEDVDSDGEECISYEKTSLTAPGYELVLGDKVVGHRNLKQFYKQNARPQEERQAVISNLIACYEKMGVKADPTALIIRYQGKGPIAKNEVHKQVRVHRSKLDLRTGLSGNNTLRHHYKNQSLCFG